MNGGASVYALHVAAKICDHKEKGVQRRSVEGADLLSKHKVVEGANLLLTHMVVVDRDSSAELIVGFAVVAYAVLESGGMAAHAVGVVCWAHIGYLGRSCA